MIDYTAGEDIARAVADDAEDVAADYAAFLADLAGETDPYDYTDEYLRSLYLNYWSTR